MVSWLLVVAASVAALVKLPVTSLAVVVAVCVSAAVAVRVKLPSALLPISTTVRASDATLPALSLTQQASQ